jgi:hypothetical protein
MICAGMDQKFANGAPMTNGIVIGFTATIGKALAPIDHGPQHHQHALPRKPDRMRDFVPALLTRKALCAFSAATAAERLELVNDALRNPDDHSAIEAASHLEAPNDCTPLLCRVASLVDGSDHLADHRRPLRLLHRHQDDTT